MKFIKKRQNGLPRFDFVYDEHNATALTGYTKQEKIPNIKLESISHPIKLIMA